MLRMRARLSDLTIISQTAVIVPQESRWMFAACCKPTIIKKGEKLNHLGIDVGKRKCRAAIKDDKGNTIDEFFFSNDKNDIFDLISRTQSYGKCSAVVEATGNMWMRIHDMLEDKEIGTDFWLIHT